MTRYDVFCDAGIFHEPATFLRDRGKIPDAWKAEGGK